LEKLLCKDQFNSPRRHRDAEDLIAAVEGSSAVVLPFRRMRIGSNGPAVTRYLPLIAPKCTRSAAALMARSFRRTPDEWSPNSTRPAPQCMGALRPVPATRARTGTSRSWEGREGATTSKIAALVSAHHHRMVSGVDDNCHLRQTLFCESKTKGRGCHAG
jgi:hypothetical protein